MVLSITLNMSLFGHSAPKKRGGAERPKRFYVLPDTRDHRTRASFSSPMRPPGVRIGVVWLLRCRKVPLPFAVLTWLTTLVGFSLVAAARKAQGGLIESGVALSILWWCFVSFAFRVKFKELDCTPLDSWKFISGSSRFRRNSWLRHPSSCTHNVRGLSVQYPP